MAVSVAAFLIGSMPAWAESALDTLEAELTARALAAGTVRATYRVRTRMPVGALPAHEAEGLAVLDYACAPGETADAPPRERFLFDYSLEGRADDQVFETWFRGVYDGTKLRAMNGLHTRAAGAPPEPPRPAPVRDLEPKFLIFFLPAPGTLLWRTLREDLPNIAILPADPEIVPAVHTIETLPNPDWPAYSLIRRAVFRIDAATGIVRSAEYFGPEGQPVLQIAATDWAVGVPIPPSAFDLE